MIKMVKFFKRFKMTRQELNILLEKAQITKEEFSQKVGLKYASVNNWGSSQNVPHWVETWLELYIENKQCKKLKEAISQMQELN